MNRSNSVRGIKFSLLISTIIAFGLAIVLSFSALQDSNTLRVSDPFQLQLEFVFAQTSEGPVLRYSDDAGNPVFNQPGFTAEVVAEGLSLPTTMALLSQNDILVLEKDKGTVMRVIDGEVQPQPLLDVNVATEVERCMCGIAISQNNETGNTYVFLYYTEAEGEDGGAPIGNRLYRYELENGQPGGSIGADDIDSSPEASASSPSSAQLVNPTLLLDLPAVPGPRHNGGAITIGPDNNLYIPIGDTDKVTGGTTQTQNNDELPADGAGGILRVTQDGEPVLDPSTGSYILGEDYPFNLYYAYGIRNSFGIGFDPVTGNLWDSENGPGYGDEINLVYPGFNSGWNQIQGVWQRGDGDPREGQSTIASVQPEGLVDFDGNGQYQAPKLTFLYTIGPTALKFLDSTKYGAGYQNDLFLGDVHAGNLYHFSLNEDRTELLLPQPLIDRIADTDTESNSEAIVFATGFAGISDIEVSPYDGYMYVVSLGQGKIFKILPTSELDMSASGDSVPTFSFTSPETPLPPAEDETVEDVDEDNIDQIPEDESEDEDEEDEDEEGSGGGNDEGNGNGADDNSE
ncbi:MAG TPA: PQQ-dependent sugar dehydrogenase [Nitrososphaeraceae archaeon]|nr:PQQ-dependent sugar dehydrogenase [Nitrososphaeraceae archaeon]